jgi:hypothetical protein
MILEAFCLDGRSESLALSLDLAGAAEDEDEDFRGGLLGNSFMYEIDVGGIWWCRLTGCE